ncbi:MFS transporter [Amycolatopsis taiwanensis]|uniref:Major facilitator superfamily protein n=1 Tax=Amycolatopsis taiwanensis TaxID=342230 RepID=A0A9W6VLI8_9PSEU|nr:MFS transporter [Amycolatopsis taiwanensis]GLY70566.1 major facilitator superfamily protein [Amycolatopsis taiwanensis]
MTKPALRGSDPVTDAPVARTVFVMTVAGLLVVGQMYLVLPLLAAMARDWHTSATAVTWTATSFGFAYAAGFLITGPLSDLLGRRRVVVTGLSLLAVATIAAAFAPTLPVLIACRIVQGIGAAGFSPAALAYLSERIPPARRSVAVSCLVTAMVAATVTGQLVAQALDAVAGWRGIFGFNAGFVAVLVVVLRLVMLPDLKRQAGSSPGAFFRAMKGPLTSPVLVLIYLGALSVLSAFVAIYTALQLLGPPELVGNPGAMLTLRASSLPALVAIPLLAPVLARVRPALRAALALASAACTVVVLAVVGQSSAFVVGALMFLFVGKVAVVSPGLTELVGQLSGVARGAGVALYTFALLVGASLGPQLVSLLGGHGFTVVLIAIAGSQLAGAALVLAADRRCPR